MTRFQRDMEAALAGDEQRVLTERKAEIQKLMHEVKTVKNKFRQMCIAQDIARLKAEYEVIDSKF